MHSPSPFKLGDRYSLSQDEIEDRDGRCVAVVWTRRSPVPGASHETNFKDCPVGKANAALFIAAPEMRRLLADLVEWNAQMAESDNQLWHDAKALLETLRDKGA